MEMSINRELLKQLRLQKSWSQEKLAESAGISLRTIQRMEMEGTASLQSRNAIARALGVDVADLLSDQKQTESPTTGDIANTKAQTQTLSAWPNRAKKMFKFILLATLWLAMVTVAFLIFATLVSGVFFWEQMGITFWASVGQGLIGGAIFVPFFMLFYYLYRRITRSPESLTSE